MASSREPGSFRDPSGYLFRRDGALLRYVSTSYAPHYERLMTGGLYDALVKDGRLVPHEEVDLEPGAFRVLRPALVPFVSYPYEWSFGQLKDAALLTLDLQSAALERGMTLKDATAYNVQFLDGRPVLIDTLSFEIAQEGAPWVAYRQFCQHFLAPLALMARVDVRLGGLSRLHLDGVPLDLAARLLPTSAWLSFGLATHVLLHARSQVAHANDAAGGGAPAKVSVSRTAMLGLIDSLRGAVSGLDWTPAGTEWADYYAGTNYGEAAHAHKKQLVAAMVRERAPGVVWDLGANTGVFSAIAAEAGARVVALDIDPGAVERHWRAVRGGTSPRVLPILGDLTNASPAQGWAHEERKSLAERGPADLALALALVHHLAIGNNVPLPRVASWLARLGRTLVIEWVPKEDSQVRRMLASREDVFPDYTQAGFEAALAGVGRIVRKEPVAESVRTLYVVEA